METWKIKPVFDRKKKATPEKSAKVEIEIQLRYRKKMDLNRH